MIERKTLEFRARGRGAGGGFNEPAGMWRTVQAFEQAGADLVFPTGVSPAQLAEIRRRVPRPAMIVDMAGATLDDEARAGAAIVLYYGMSALVHYDALDRALATFKATRDAGAIPGYRERVQAFEEFMGYREFAARARSAGADPKDRK